MTSMFDQAATFEEHETLGPKRWFLVQCKPGQNLRARDNLENQGYGCFDPKLRVERIRKGRRQVRTESLFPGYLFIELALSGQSWHEIRSTRGVRQLVRFGTAPVPVPGEVIDELRRRSEDVEAEAAPAFQPGDTLRIKKGPFANLDGVFERFDGDERVIVLLDMLQKQHRLTLNATDVEAG